MQGFSILEINSRVWAAGFRPKKKGQAGTLDSVPDTALDEISSAGYDAIWLMGAWSRGAQSREIALAHEGLRSEFARALPDWTPNDVASSPFAVAEYRTAAELGGDEAMQRFRKKLNRKGLRLILDFVPNHTARDHRFIRTSPELYVCPPAGFVTDKPWNFFEAETDRGKRMVAHGRDPFFDGWTDTAQLDYRNPDTMAAMAGELRTITGACDGVRCDMAMLVLSDVFARTWADIPFGGSAVPGEFWSRALDSAREVNPEFLFMAEVYWGLESRLAELGFDFVYDKILYDALKRRDVRMLDGLIGRDGQRAGWGLRFIENHDEERAATAFAADAQVASAVAALTLPGARLIHKGQESGEKTRLPVQLLRKPEEHPDPAIVSLYASVLPVMTSPVLRDGEWRRLDSVPASEGDYSCSNILAWRWELRGKGAVISIVNLSGEKSRARIPMQIKGLRDRSVTFKDVIDGSVYVRDGNEMCDHGLYIELGPGCAHLLRIEGTAPKGGA